MAAALSAGGDAVQARLGLGRLGSSGLAEGEDDRQQRRCEENSPEGDDDAEYDGAEEGSPPGDLGCAVQNVRADDEAFEDNDQTVESEHQAEAPFVVAAEGNGEDWADESDHASEGGDDLEEAAKDCPEGRPRNTDEFEADEPENTDDESVERGGSPPVESALPAVLR